MACMPTSEPTLEKSQVAGTSNVRRSQSISHTTPGDRRSGDTRTGDTRTGDKRARGPDGIGLEARRMTKQRKPQTVDDIIKNLVYTVLQGSMDNSREAPMTAIGFEELANSILTRCQATASSKELDNLLLKLADEFRKNMKSVQREAKISAWFNWYFASCLHRFHHQRQSAKRDRGQDQPSCAIEVLHSIVNTLLFTDGANALSVVSAFAARGHILSGAAKRSAGDRQLIITGVADKLKGKLQVSNDFAIPIPAAYVARILDNENNAGQPVDPNSTTATHEYHSSLQACRYLSMPNLAVLRLQATSKDDKLLFGGMPFSDLQARWAAFENATPQIERLRRLLYLAEDFDPSIKSPLSQLQASIELLESGNLSQALEALERSEQECLADHTQGMPEHAAEKLALVRKASSLLLSHFSDLVRDWLEPKGIDTNDSLGSPGGNGFVWDETWDWLGTGISDLIEPDGTETLSMFFDIH
ncbi:hypothetical protein QQX98_013002 [Neonectria punicea]|uniref:Uncharacterized protein n=1 Tax=Neonectria punicea TaxID=979145 RepID=A0ABR1GHI3_9HYPO